MNAPLLFISLDGERPASWNKFYSGTHFTTRTAEVARVRRVVRAALDPTTTVMFAQPVVVALIAYFHDHIQDADNLAVKLYVDALKGWCLEDDDPAHVAGVYTASRHDKARPRVELFLFDAALPLPNFPGG